MQVDGTRLPAALHPPVTVALAREVDANPDPDALEGGCLYEPKWDGYRIVILRDGETTVLISRQGTDLTGTFPDLAQAAAEQLPPGCAVDGEAVIWSEGRLDFPALQQRISASPRNLAGQVHARPASFIAFDLLAVAGHDTRPIPLSERRELLEELASHWEPPLNLSAATTDPEEAAAWFEELHTAGIEGILAKGCCQDYRGGRRQWVKVKHRSTVDVVCAAVTGSLERPDRIVIGLPVEGRLQVVGRSLPIKAPAARDLGRLLTPGGHEWPWTENDLTGTSRFGRETLPAIPVDPVVVEISADATWTGTSFRHLVRYLRARPELDPYDVELPKRLDRRTS